MKTWQPLQDCCRPSPPSNSLGIDANRLAGVQEPVTEIYTRPGPLPVQAAIDIAYGVGLVSVSSTDKWFNEWQIEGRDVTGRYIEVDVDARTGAIVDVDR